MPTRQKPAQRPVTPTERQPAASSHVSRVQAPVPQAARRHGLNKPVTPTTRRAETPLVARARRTPSPNTIPAKPATEQRGASAPTRIKVRALEQGYYDHIRRHEGDVFYIAQASDFSERWMEVVADSTPERVTSAPEKLRREHDRLLAERMPAPGTPLVHDEPDADKNPLGA